MMVSKSLLSHLRSLAIGPQANTFTHEVSSIRHHISKRRCMATVADVTLQQSVDGQAKPTRQASPGRAVSTEHVSVVPEDHITTTIYSFPYMEPLRFAYYPRTHLHLPFRKDILHRAVVYEGDMTRLGTASTKWRDDVHGSHHKVRPQKGTGRARLGDKQSPTIKGGGVAFGPKPRDFSTKLPRKMYDLAWRTALSYRYRKGELIVVEDIEKVGPAARWWLEQIFDYNGWGNASGRSLLVAKTRTTENNALFDALDTHGDIGKMVEAKDVDVKDLLEKGRVIIEQKALNNILKRHASDLVAPMAIPNIATMEADTV